MESRLLALKLLLDEFGVPCSIERFRERKQIQKIVYLAQLQALDLGYRYGWYLRGPYCPELAGDYYRLWSELSTAPPPSSQFRGDVKRALSELKPLLEVPEDVDLEDHDWLELLASVHYLLRVKKKEIGGAKSEIESCKQHVAHHFEKAVNALNSAHLLN